MEHQELLVQVELQVRQVRVEHQVLAVRQE